MLCHRQVATCAAVAASVVVLMACGTPFSDASHPAPPSSPGSTARGCSPSPAGRSPFGTQELRGTVTPGNSLWALIESAPPLPVGRVVKTIWRMTGSEPITLMAEGPGSQRLKPDWGPEAHSGSNWTRPGQEWGAGFTFPVAGCWTVQAARLPVSGHVSFVVG